MFDYIKGVLLYKTNWRESILQLANANALGLLGIILKIQKNNDHKPQ